MPRGVSFLAVAAAAAVTLSACGSTPQGKGAGKSSRTTEYFPESEWGVKASPRVSTKASGLPRGGGREQIGRPYQIRGQWFRPREKEPGHTREGRASWYGSAFHGRLTANGEVYDRTHLTAAHPTMPLPSYARVTNLSNNSSVVVRVNDRGPFARGRIIDLSERAADMLGYRRAGVANVKVEYIGRAPLHGQDDAYLMASYRPGGSGAPRPGNEGLPSGVMIAMAGSTPSAPGARGDRPAAALPSSRPAPVPAPAQQPATASFPPPPAASVQVAGMAHVPSAVPVSFDRPSVPVPTPPPGRAPAIGPTGPTAMSFLFYAGTKANPAAAAFRRFDGDGGQDAWKVLSVAPEPASSASLAGEYISAATFTSRTEAEVLAGKLGAYGSATVEAGEGGFSVLLASDGRYDMDRLLAIAWSSGAPDAMPVRD